MNELRIYWQESVLYSNLTNYFSVGYIDTIGVITDITISSNLEIIILEPNTSTLTRNANNSGLNSVNVTPSDTNVSLVIKLEYITATFSISQVLSYTLVPQINLLNQNDIQLLISRVLPPNVYNVGVNSTVYPRLYGIANTLVSLYQKTTIEEIITIFNFIDSIYPINGDPSWEITLDGTQSLLYQSTQPQYGELLQHIYATTINNDNNPYYYAYNISKFISLLLYNPNNSANTPYQYYVALDENKADINKSFIIANNRLDNIILSATNNELQLNVNIFPSNFITNPPLYSNQWQKNIINQYIRRITRCAVSPIISYGPIPTLPDTSYLGNTYWGDPRQSGTYCIAYNPGILEQAKGYILPIINIREVQNITFQILIGASWTDFTTSNIPVSQGISYKLRLTVIPVNPLNPPNIPNPSQYGQFYIGNNGIVSDITVNYNPNATDNDSYFTIVFNISGNISVNAYGLWFYQVGTFTIPRETVQADFRFSPLAPTTTDTVVFTDTTPTPLPTNYAWSILPATGWNFVTPSTSASKNPSIQFTNANTYYVTNAPTGNAIYMTKTKPVLVTLPPTNPTVLLTSPNPTTNVSLTALITLTFSEAVTGVTPTSTPSSTGTIQLNSAGSGPQPITITQSDNSYTLTPIQALVRATQYFVTVNSGIQSVATGRAVVPIQFNFTTTTDLNTRILTSSK